MIPGRDSNNGTPQIKDVFVFGEITERLAELDKNDEVERAT